MTYHVILFVITLNDIPLNPPIAFTYHLVPDGSPFRYTKPHSFTIEKHSIRHHTCWNSLFFFFLRFRLIIIKQLAIQAFFGSNPQLKPEKLGDKAHGLLDPANTGTV